MAWIKQRPVAEKGSATTPSDEAPRAVAHAPARERNMESIVNIGQSVEIKGTLTGNEDLTIEGMVDGKILVKDHSLTIGANGRISAEVHAKTIVVVGQVVGNITADDKVEIAPSGSVEGDIRAPRVSIADGAKFTARVLPRARVLRLRPPRTYRPESRAPSPRRRPSRSRGARARPRVNP